MNTRSTFTTSFIAQRSKLKLNGKAPILARIIVNGQKAHFSTKLDTAPDRWIPSKGKTLGFTKEEKRINSVIDDFRALIRTRYYDMFTHGEAVTADKIKRSVLGFGPRNQTILELFDSFNGEYRQKVGKEVCHRTYTRYVLTRKLLVEFLETKYGRRDFALCDIGPKFVDDFFLWLRTRDNSSHNYHMKFIQRFRTVYNVALDNGWVQADPFAKFKMHFEEVNRGYLTQAEVDLIRCHQFGCEKLLLVRDMFIFSVYTGLCYSDISMLTPDNVQKRPDGTTWIVTARQKTKVGVSVRVLDIPLRIMEKYSGCDSQGKLLPIPDNITVNRLLREITAACGITRKITFHVARHTCATTIMLDNGVPIETVSKLLGHKNIRTTQIYARITDQRMNHDLDLLAAKLNVPAQQMAGG